MKFIAIILFLCAIMSFGSQISAESPTTIESWNFDSTTDSSNTFDSSVLPPKVPCGGKKLYFYY
ncbi:hypothetical protein KR074_004410 [Drosophila pseudoananassae]|nr:hypothetical protein KR074_004410 [Drosophila pseudoananassae]